MFLLLLIVIPGFVMAHGPSRHKVKIEREINATSKIPKKAPIQTRKNTTSTLLKDDNKKVNEVPALQTKIKKQEKKISVPKNKEKNNPKTPPVNKAPLKKESKQASQINIKPSIETAKTKQNNIPEDTINVKKKIEPTIKQRDPLKGLSESQVEALFQKKPEEPSIIKEENKKDETDHNNLLQPNRVVNSDSITKHVTISQKESTKFKEEFEHIMEEDLS